MQVQSVEQFPFFAPHAADGRIHDLDQTETMAPDHHKMREASGEPHNGDGGQGIGGERQELIRRHHDLLRFQSQPTGSFLDRIDRSTIDIGVAGFAQAFIARADAESSQETAEAGGPAVHRRRLDDFGNDKAAREHGMFPDYGTEAEFLVGVPA